MQYRIHIERTGCRVDKGRQQGAVALIFVIGMVAIVGMAGLALDGGHVMLEKAVLQTAVDAAALGGAKAIDETPGDTNRARGKASDVFGRTATALGNEELGAAWTSGGVTLQIQFSDTLNPFTPGSPDGPYVRAIASGYTLPAWLTPVLGFDQFIIEASAVAGPSPGIGDQAEEEACDIAPLTLCEDPDGPTGPNYVNGYELHSPQMLKSTAWGDGDIGSGNFQAIRVGGSGASIYRQNMAGGVEGLCVNDGDQVTVETEPGNMVGPTAQGLNTRFGKYGGGGMNAADYPPDLITRQDNPRLEPCEVRADPDDPDFRQICRPGTEGYITAANLHENSYDWATYDSDMFAGNFTNPPDGATGPPGVAERRIVQIPVTDCSGLNNGQSTLPVVGTICFYLIQEVEHHGLDSYIFGEVIEDCGGAGIPGSTPGPGTSAAYIIQLYDDPDSTDS